MKKLTTVLLLLTMLCALFVGSAYADTADVEVTVTSNATEVNVGDTITVTVAIDHETALTGFGLPYEYNKEILKVVGVPAFNSGFLAAGGMAMPSATTALWLGMGASSAYTGDLLTITFEVIGGIGETTEIGIKASGTDGFKGLGGATLTANVTPATIKVICAHANGTELQNAKEATCSAEGYTGDEVCKTCGETVVAGTVIEKTAHGETELKNAKDATCSAEGYTGDAVCKACGETVTVGTVIDKLPHGETELKNAKDATCSAEGYTGDTVCKACGETVTVGSVIDKKAHTPGEAVKEKEVAADCTTAGSYDNVVYCTVCEKELSRETVTVPALGHTEGDVVVENDKKPTCTEEGSYDNVVYCTVCTKEISREKVTVEALGHDEKIDEAVEPTCTETGLTEGSHCERCKEVLVAQTVVDALNHDVKIDVAVEPTCTDTGLTEGKHCDRCGEVLVAQTVVDALGHTGGEATCVKRAVCDRCSQEYGELNKDNHKGTSDLIGAKDPTCTEDGATGTGTCSDCGAELEASEVIPALGHAWDEGVVTTPATCEADGVKTFTCGRCGDIYTEAVAKLGHAYDSGVETTPATCEADGVKTFTCQNDATHTYTEAIPAIGHNYDEGTVTTEPTCEADGVKTFVCANDPSHTYTEAVAAIGHDWELTETIIAPACEADGEGVYTCKNDASHTKNDVIEKLGHAWDEGTVTKEATTSEEGEMTYKCTVEGCDGTFVEPIEKLKPSGGNSGSGSDKDNSNIPDTGDDAPIALMAAILTVCAAGVVVLTSKKRKNEI